MKTRLVALVLALGIPSWSQTPIRGPMLGWVWDSRQESIRPVQGILGSSVLGGGADLGAPVKFAAIAGNQEFALVLAGDNKELRLVDLRPVDPAASTIDVPAQAGKVVLSPRSRSAALWYPETKTMRILSGLPESPALLREFDFANEDAPASFALTDDGRLLLASYPEQKFVLIVDQDSNRWKFDREITARGLAFLENSNDALLSADEGVFFVRDIAANPDSRRIWEGAATAAAGLDANRILLIDSANQGVVELNLDSGDTRNVQCPCAPTGFSRMIGSGIFRLNEVSRAPLWLLELRDSGLRTVFVPPDASDSETEN